MTPPAPSVPARPPAATFVVLAKAPVPGLVKTRLTSAYSDHEAAALAAAALLDSLDAVRAAVALAGPGERRLVCALTGDLDAAAAPVALGAGLEEFRVVAQRGEGLGERIAHAHADAAASGNEDAAADLDGATVQIGMDTPQVDPAVLAAAADRVTVPDGPDAVLGAAADGGWWLLALRRAADARLVAPVPMSTPETGRLTRRALEDAGLRVEAAPVLSDVDEPGDVVRVAASCPDSRFAALAGVLGGRAAVAS
ncbi:DUF2064 domain-containing protein [Microlunatus spumicola]|uniref:DUF2064 domain-containing protein n=1 Tax=Microlunatus spumicola TaxID=81499 RepID=A0ABP6XH45_9ACTN